MKRVYKNVFASILPQFANIVTNLILPGLIIVKFGSEVNGLVTTTKTIVSYISIVGAGIATAVTQALYAPLAKKDVDEIKGMLHAANNMFVKYGMVYIFLTLVLSLVYPLFVSSNVNYITIASLLIVMSLSGASEFFITGRCRALLYADQKVYICNIIQATSLFVSLLTALVMLKLDVGIVWVQLAISLVYIIRAAVLLHYVNSRYPELRRFKETKALQKTVQKRNDAMIHQLSGLAVTGSQSLILSVLVGFHAASIYAVYNIIFSGLQSVCASLNTAVTPYLGKELSLYNEKKARDIYDIIEFSFTVLVSFVFSVAIFMVIPFVHLYTADADINYICKDFSILFAFSSMFYVLKMPGTAAINASGHFKETRSRALAEAGICIVLGVVFTLLIGKNGVLMGTLIALGWRCFDTILYANKYILKCGNKTSLKRVGLCIALVVTSTVLSLKFDPLFASYTEWIFYACAVAVICILLIAFLVVLFDRRTLKRMLTFVWNNFCGQQ